MVWPEIVSKPTWEAQKFQNILGEHPPRPPQSCLEILTNIVSPCCALGPGYTTAQAAPLVTVLEFETTWGLRCTPLSLWASWHFMDSPFPRLLWKLCSIGAYDFESFMPGYRVWFMYLCQSMAFRSWIVYFLATFTNWKSAVIFCQWKLSVSLAWGDESNVSRDPVIIICS